MTLPPAVMVGRFQRFGASATGSTSKTVLLSGTLSALLPGDLSGQNQGNYAAVEKFKVTVAKSGSNSLFQLEISANGISYTEIARVEIPDWGIVSDPDVGLYIPAGYAYKVSVTQGTAARCSASLLGRTAQSDIVDV